MTELYDVPVQPQLLQELRRQRETLAEEAARKQMYRTLYNADRIDHGSPSVFSRAEGHLGYDCGVLSPDELLALEANGLDGNNLLSQLAEHDSDTVIATINSGNESVAIYPLYDTGVTLRKTKQSGSDEPANYESAVKARYQESPAHDAVRGMVQSFGGDFQHMPERVESRPFDGLADPLASLVFLQDIGLAHTSYALRNARDHGGGLQAELQLSLRRTAERSDKVLIDDDDMTVYRWGREAKQTLKIDKETGQWTYAISIYPEDAYEEIANQAPDISSEPFIDTECARDVAAWLEANGLAFSDNIAQEMVRTGDAERYGGVYTQLTREVAKWVMDDNRISTRALFKIAETELAGIDDEREEQAIRKVLSEADFSQLDMSEPAKVLLAMAQQAVNTPRPDKSDLPVATGEIKLRDYSCFDVLAYYVGAASLTQAGDREGLCKRDEQTPDGKTVRLLDKLHGGKTTLSTEPLTFNGVELPKGSLFMRQPDGSYAFLRLTPFSFDKPEDQRAFGSEIDKAYRQQAESVRAIGGMSLSSLVSVVR